MPFRPAVHVPLIFAAFGLVFFIPGLWLSLSKSSEREASRGALLVTVTASTLRTRPIAEVVLVEGKLATSNRAGFREFVVYHRDRFDGTETSGVSEGKERWVPIETITPPLTIDSADGVVAVVNAAYEIRNPGHHWRGLNPASKFLGRGEESAAGFVVGDTVTVEGRVIEAAATAGVATHDRALEALVVTGGDRAAYLAHLSGGIVATRIIGVVFVGLGAVFVALAIWLRLRLGQKASRRSK